MVERIARSAEFALTTREQLFLLSTVWIPAVHLLVIAAVAVAPRVLDWNAWWGLPAAIAALYLLPPIVARACGATRLPEGDHAIGSAAFRRWWLVAQTQAIFNRLPLLEEFLRLVPGLYSTWLRLWGSSIGGMVFWSPGTLVLDRSLLVVGRRVVVGGGTRLTPHVIAPVDGSGGASVRLTLGRIRLGDGATIGGASILSPGVTVDAGVATRAALVAPPFSALTAEGRVRGAGAVAR